MTLVRTAKPVKPEPKKAAAKFTFMDYRLLLAIALLIPCLFLLAGFSSQFIPSESMIPTLTPGDHIITMKSWLAYPFGAAPKRGDIIVFRLDDSRIPVADSKTGEAGTSPESEILIKRIIGLPNETIFIDGNNIYINGAKLIESHDYVLDSPKLKNTFVFAVGKPYKIPPEQYFVLGDNRLTSFDSRYWGSVPREDILGRFSRVLYHQDYTPSKQNEGR